MGVAALFRGARRRVGIVSALTQPFLADLIGSPRLLVGFR